MASNIKINMRGRRGSERKDCLFYMSVSEGQRIASYMIAGRANRGRYAPAPAPVNCVFDGAVVLLLRSRRGPGLGSLGFQDAPGCSKDSTKKELRK